MGESVEAGEIISFSQCKLISCSVGSIIRHLWITESSVCIRLVVVRTLITVPILVGIVKILSLVLVLVPVLVVSIVFAVVVVISATVLEPFLLGLFSVPVERLAIFLVGPKIVVEIGT